MRGLLLLHVWSGIVLALDDLLERIYTTAVLGHMKVLK